MPEDNEQRRRPEIKGYALLAQPPAVGRTARVFRGVNLDDGIHYAIKVLTASVEQSHFLEEAFKRETQSLTELRHPNVLRMHSSGITAHGERYLILDWLETDMPAWKKASSEFDWLSFWPSVGRPLTQGVAHAHSRGISHRDLAPRNIMFDAAGRPVIADFGIAKLRRFLRSDQTLRQFASPPFTPPEIDDGSATAGRDVFSLAALFCWAASSQELETYEGVRSVASDTSVFPPAVSELLLDALSNDPDERPRAAGEWLERLDALAAANGPRRSSALSCQLAIGHNQSHRICKDFELGDRRATEAAILDDLSSVCAIEPLPDSKEGAFGDLAFYGLTRSYHVRPDEISKDRFVILGVRQRPSGWLEAQRERAITPKVDFRFTSRSLDADRHALSQIQRLVDDFLHERAEAESHLETRLLDTWARILQAKQELELGREKPIRYHGFTLDGRRVVFRAVGPVAEPAAEEKRQVRLQDGTYLLGHIEEVEGRHVTFLISSGNPELLRGEGEISVNVWAASEAIRKQQKALDAFRQRTVDRPHMADVLLAPDAAEAAEPASITEWFQLDLDADKQKAVAAALSSPDVLLLRGPPGTGKTTFIAELIMQTLKANPEARILLASQTHVAIDNAVERLAELRDSAGLQFELVRLGTNDERISPNVAAHRLHRRLQAWTEEVSQRVAAYAEKKAAEQGVSRKTVLLGMTLEQLVAFAGEVRELSASIEAQEADLAKVPEGKASSGNPQVDLDVAGNLAARRLDLAQMQERRRLAQQSAERMRDELVKLGEPSLASVRGPELAAAAATLLVDDDAASELRPLIELGADWIARFGRQDHFEGPFLSTVHVVAGTCLGVVGPKSSGERRFDLCIVDEASKATPTEILVPMSLASRWVLVGDSKQLPPFQDQAMRRKEFLQQHELRPEDVSESLFGYLERTLPDGNVVALSSQRRMLKPINDLIQSCFYPDDELICKRDKAKHRFAPLLKSVVTWLDTSHCQNRGEKWSEIGNGYYNKLEAELIGRLLRKLNKQFARRAGDTAGPRVTVAVITGYAEQVRMLERTLRPRSPAWTHIEVMLNTVDAFQGRQADMVVYSVTRSNSFRSLGFLDQPPRLNVALSRGKDALVIVGDRSFCLNTTGDNPFRDVIRYIDRADGCIVEEVTE